MNYKVQYQNDFEDCKREIKLKSSTMKDAMEEAEDIRKRAGRSENGFREWSIINVL